jgi:Protein of unknown function (DUF1569)
MPLPNIFDTQTTNSIIDRINKLNANSQPTWGSMSVDKMLAHCNVTYEMLYTDIHPKPNAFIRFILKVLVKQKVVSETPYQQNGKTAPAFIIKEAKNFEIEKQRLIDFINKTQQQGEAYFDGKVSPSFGPLSKTEWNNMFYKHLHHHLTQFGV